MTYRYTLRSGKVILINFCEHFLCSDRQMSYCVLPNKDFSSPNGAVKVLVDKEAAKRGVFDPYFEIDGERRSFSHYDYLTIDQLIKKIHQGALTKGEVDRDQFMATLLKESDNIGFVFVNAKYPFDEALGEVFVPVETDKFSKVDWEFKVPLQHGEILGEIFTSDLFRCLCDGTVKLVDRNNALANKPIGKILGRILKTIKKPI